MQLKKLALKNFRNYAISLSRSLLELLSLVGDNGTRQNKSSRRRFDLCVRGESFRAGTSETYHPPNSKYSFADLDGQSDDRKNGMVDELEWSVRLGQKNSSADGKRQNGLQTARDCSDRLFFA